MACIADLLQTKSRLVPVSDSAALDVELLLCHCLKKTRSYLRSWPEYQVDATTEQRFLSLLARRVAGEPIAYLTGIRGFWTFELEVNSSTLIPRPETELLVEKTLALVSSAEKARVLDLGTGTGAVALALASERPNWQVYGVDIQPQAVALARRNAMRLKLNNIEFFESDWFAQVLHGPGVSGSKSALEPCFDIIVSNPPYIDPQDQHLQQGDVRFEPHTALVSDKQGLADIEKLIASAPDYLKPGGSLLLEHGYDQGVAVNKMMYGQGFGNIQTHQDLAGHDRVTAGTKP